MSDASEMNYLDYLVDVLVGERRLLGQLGVGGAAHDDTTRLQLLAQLGGDARKSTLYLRGVTASARRRLNQRSLAAKLGKLAFRPLGFGSTKTSAP